MNIYLNDQKDNLKQHLDSLKLKQVMSYEKTQLTEKISAIEIKTTKKIYQLNLDVIFDYHIFPVSIMTFKNQWTDENRKMQIGDTIAQQVYIPPTKFFSQKIIFGVRVNEIIDKASIKGFSYETLEGHVEKGISTFTVEQLNQKIIFKIKTYSIPGNILSKVFGPVISIPYQIFCTKKALINVKRQLENQ